MQPGDEVVGGRPHPEGDLVDAVEGRLEVDLHVDVAGRDARGRRPGIASGGEGMQPRAHRPEPRDHVGDAERGELAQRADAEPGEQPDQLGLFEQRDRQRRQERALLARAARW